MSINFEKNDLVIAHTVRFSTLYSRLEYKIDSQKKKGFSEKLLVCTLTTNLRLFNRGNRAHSKKERVVLLSIIKLLQQLYSNNTYGLHITLKCKSHLKRRVIVISELCDFSQVCCSIIFFE
jgi:hypothetical protein